MTKKTEKTNFKPEKKGILEGLSAKKLPTPKTYSQTNRPNPHIARLKVTESTKPYQIASEKLKPRTYAEKKFSEKEMILTIRDFYPFISVILGVSVAYGGGKLFFEASDTFGYYASIVAVCALALVIFGVLETLKVNTAKNFFSELPSKRGSGHIALMIYFLLSASVSGFGGYLLNIQTNDKTAEITAQYGAQTDSVKRDISAQIEILNLAITENKNRIKTGSKWVRYHAQKDLANLQAQKTELLKLQKNEVSELESRKITQINTADLINKNKGFLLTFIVIILELLYIFSFKYEYAVERKINTENQNDNYENTAVETIPAQTQNFDPLHQIGLFFVNELLANQQMQFSSVPVSQNTGGLGAGFKLGNQFSQITSKPSETSKGVQKDFKETSKGAEINPMIPEERPIQTSKNVARNFEIKAETEEKPDFFETGKQFDFLSQTVKKAPQKTKTSNYWKDYPELCAELVKLNSGEINTTRGKLAKKYSVSESTIYRAQTSIFSV